MIVRKRRRENDWQPMAEIRAGLLAILPLRPRPCQLDPGNGCIENSVPTKSHSLPTLPATMNEANTLTTVLSTGRN